MRNFLASLTLATALLGSLPAQAQDVCGDVNQSGDLTTSDALAVLRKAVGQDLDLICPVPGTPLKTGQTTALGTGSDGDLELGLARSFTDNGDGTITDNVTGLMWEKKDNSGGIHDWEGLYTWSAAGNNLDGTLVTTFLAGLNDSQFAGYSDWRIPNRVELATIQNLGDNSPATFPEFQGACPDDCTVLTCSCTLNSAYWTSTSTAATATQAWTLDFTFGGVGSNLKVNAARARAVRTASAP